MAVRHTATSTRMLVAALVASSARATHAHTYTYAKGALLVGDDVAAPANMTLAEAEATCSALPSCIGITFRTGAKVRRAV